MCWWTGYRPCNDCTPSMVEVWKDRHVEENRQWWASYHQVSWHTWEQRMGFCKQLYKGVVHWQPDRISELPVQTHKSELPEKIAWLCITWLWETQEDTQKLSDHHLQSWMAVTSCHYSQVTSSTPDNGCRFECLLLCSESRSKKLYKNSVSCVSVTFPEGTGCFTIEVHIRNSVLMRRVQTILQCCLCYPPSPLQQRQHLGLHVLKQLYLCLVNAQMDS